MVADMIQEVGARLTLLGRAEFVDGIAVARKAIADLSADAKLAAKGNTELAAATREVVTANKEAARASSAASTAQKKLTDAVTVFLREQGKAAEVIAAGTKATQDAAKAAVEQAAAEKDAAEAMRATARAALDQANARLAAAKAAQKAADDEVAAAKTSAAATKKANEDKSGSFDKLGKVMKTAVVGVGVAAGIAGVASLKFATDFQTQLTRLYTAAGAPKQAVLANANAIVQLGTSVGQTGTAMAEALYHPVSAGLDLATAMQVVKYSAQEAAISGASLDDTTYSLSSVMKAFNQSGSDAGQTMALLNAIVGQGDMRFQDFNASIKNWAPTAAQMGISIQSMGAGIAYLTDRGNSAEVAATRMTMGISMMTTPSAQAAKLLEGLGVASSDVTASSEAMTTVLRNAHITQNDLALDLQKPDGLYVALKHLQTALHDAGVSGTEADSLLAKVFGGGRSDKAIMSLLQNLDGVKTKFDDIGAASTTAQFTKNWEDAKNTFSFQMRQIKDWAENTGIMLGSWLLPKMSSAIGSLESMGSRALSLVGMGWNTPQAATGPQQPAGAFAALGTGWRAADTGKRSATPTNPYAPAGTGARLPDSNRVVSTPQMPQPQQVHLTGIAAIAQQAHQIYDQGQAAISQVQDPSTAIGHWVQQVVGDLKTFGSQATSAFGDIAVALGPAAKTIGTEFLGAIKALAQVLKDQVGPTLQQFAKWLKDNPGAVQFLAQLIEVRLIGALLKLTVLNPFKGLLSGAKFLFGPITDGIGLIKKVPGAFEAVNGAYDKFLTKFGEFGRGAQRVASVAGDYISRLPAGIGKAADMLNSGLDKMGAKAVEVGGKLLDLAMAGAGKLGSLAQAAWSGVTAFGQLALSVAESGAKALWAAGAWVAQKIALGAVALWDGIVTAAQWLLNAAMDANPVGLIILGIMALVAAFIYCWTHFESFRNFWKAAWEIIKAVFGAVIDNIIFQLKIAWDVIVTAFKVGKDLVVGIFTVFTDILSGNWSKAWTDIKNFAGKIWDDIVGGIKDGINAAIDLLNGFLGAVNKIAGAVGLKINLHVEHLGGDLPSGYTGASAPMKAMATGGYVPIGHGFMTSGPQAIVGEGRPEHPEFVVPTDPKYRKRALGLYRQLGGYLGPVPMMEDGGIISEAWSWLTGTVHGAWEGIKTAADAVQSVGRQGLAAALDSVWPTLPVPNNLLGIIPSGANTMRDKVLTWVKGNAPQGAGGAPYTGPVGQGVQQWAPLVLQALQMLGQGPEWLDTVLRRMNQESGGNPNAINNWDSNAQAGDPSRGLMQTIGSTFAAYAGPFANRSIYDPMASIYAGINYAIHRGGSLAYMNRPGGYEFGGVVGIPARRTGGWINSLQPYLVGEAGPELVVPSTPGVVIPAGPTSDILSGSSGGTTGSLPSLGGQSIVFERGSVIVYESGDSRRTYEAVRSAVADRLARQ